MYTAAAAQRGPVVELQQTQTNRFIYFRLPKQKDRDLDQNEKKKNTGQSRQLDKYTRRVKDDADLQCSFVSPSRRPMSAEKPMSIT